MYQLKIKQPRATDNYVLDALAYVLNFDYLQTMQVFTLLKHKKECIVSENKKIKPLIILKKDFLSLGINSEILFVKN